MIYVHPVVHYDSSCSETKEVTGDIVFVRCDCDWTSGYYVITLYKKSFALTENKTLFVGNQLQIWNMDQ